MSSKLSNDDRCAVDLLLEHARPGGATTCLATASPQEVGERLTRMDELLHKLDSYEAGEPSDDLVARTMRRRDEAVDARGARPHAAVVVPATLQ